MSKKYEHTIMCETYLDERNKLLQTRESLWDKIERLTEALEFCKMSIDHAIFLNYVGEGSTLGMFNDASEKAEKALTDEK